MTKGEELMVEPFRIMLKELAAAEAREAERLRSVCPREDLLRDRLIALRRSYDQPRAMILREVARLAALIPPDPVVIMTDQPRLNG